MSDMVCAICGEPWDAYGVRHGDMTPAEARKFLSGQGCPSCQFGTACPHCDGTGHEPCPNHCFEEHGRRYYFDWGPKRLCTTCQGGHIEAPCTACGGSGRPSGGDILEAAESELDWSDEDPILILQRRGLL